MNKAAIAILLLCGLPACAPIGKERLVESNLVEIGPAYSATSVNTAVFRTNSLTTHGDDQYACYYDPDGYLTLGKRRLGSDKWELHRTQYTGNVADAHNVACIGIDGDGYVHVSFDHHGSPLSYCRGIEPGSLVLGDKQPMTGANEDNVTYPEFYALPDGDLLFAYRDGASGRGNLVLNRYDTKVQAWHRLQDKLIDGEDQRNAYWQICVDGNGAIHVSWVWRETWLVETNHDLCYACSTDGGATWQKSDGEKYELPITASNAEYACLIPQNSELINQTSMCADDQGHPYIAAYWRDADSDTPQYRLVWHDGSKWQQTQVGERHEPFSLAGGGTKMIPIARPRLAVDGDNMYYLMRDQERGSKVSIAINRNKGIGPWTIQDLTDFSVDAWEPSYDTELWRQHKQLDAYVQASRQGDGERQVDGEVNPAYVLEIRP